MQVASQGVDDQTKDVLAAVVQSAQSLSETDDVEEAKDSEDLSVPKWPKYTDPSS